MYPLLGLVLAVLPILVSAQSATQGTIRRAEPPAAAEPVAEPKVVKPTSSRATKAKRKQHPQPKPATPAPALASLETGDLAKRSAAELEALIAEQRSVVKLSPRDETARRNLGLISVEAANRVLDAQSMGRMQDVNAYASLIKESLADTLWRVTQLAREDPARAQAALGLYYSEGVLVPKDPVRGCDHFAKAAAAGHLAAAYRSSECLAKIDPESARRWLERSASGGNPAAQETLGRACIEGTSVDAACAKKWLEPAAAKGRVSAMSVLAWLYVREGTPVTAAKAAELYRAAADAGDLAAQNNLGELYETGRGVSRDAAQALVWYRKSAESGFAPAQFNLARLLAFGLGTERDTAAAREWATKAQGQGVAQAGELLRLIAEGEKPR
jgi:TPR repeat protein